MRSWRAIFEFDDLGLILRNRNTGKTCFFTFFGKLDPKNPAKSYSFYGGWIPAPDRNSLAPRDEVEHEDGLDKEKESSIVKMCLATMVTIMMMMLTNINAGETNFHNQYQTLWILKPTMWWMLS